MLYHLFHDLNIQMPGVGLWSYISFRAGLALILSLFISTIIGKRIIDYLKLKQMGELVRSLGLEGENSKKGTPTMGGIIIIISILLPCILVGRFDSLYMILMLVTTVWLGLLGYADDYIKVVKKDKEGMHGKFKIIGQVGLGLIVGLVLYFSPDFVIRENVEVPGVNGTEIEYQREDVKSLTTTIPFVKNHNFDYADLVPFMGEYQDIAGWVIFIFVIILVVTAVSNSANLTDGLDGLATGTSAIIGVALGILAYFSGHIEYASYFNIMYIPGSGELVVFMAAFIGATIGFLWYNSAPAQVFMGDTGSLTLGGIIAVFAILIHKELLIPILCGVFFVEALSVIIQTTYFKITKKRTGVGRRVFKMSPLHHHFQKPGNAGIDALIQRPIQVIPETKIVTRFWIIGIILAVITLVTLKIR